VKIIERKHIDDSRWNELIEKTPEASFFSYTWYLDSVAENWCALLEEDYSFGIALPFSVRLGVETLYTPIFLRYIEVLGESDQFELVQKLIHDRFKNIQISSRQKILGDNCESHVYQTITTLEERKIGSQAKRMLKKADKNSLSIDVTDDYSTILDVVKSELKNKFTGINETSLVSLERLFQAAKEQNVLKAYTIKNEGGIVCLEKGSKHLYLKGTVLEEVKVNGGMYLALNLAIESAISSKHTFDFGGSRIPGVQKFNHNLGGNDVVYYAYKIDNAPFWFKLARRIKNTWSKK
jgi:ribosomal protein S21